MANQSRGERLTGEAAGFQDCMHLFPKQWDKDRTGSYPDMSGKFWLATKSKYMLLISHLSLSYEVETTNQLLKIETSFYYSSLFIFVYSIYTI